VRHRCNVCIFLAPNKSPTKSHVFSKFPAELNYSLRNPVIFSLSHPRHACRESRRHCPHSGHRPSRAAPAPLSATTPGIPRTPRSRRPVRLAITAVPKITLTLGKFFQINHLLNHSKKNYFKIFS
jgi:hypothetical protein